MRHMRLDNPEDVERPEIEELLKAARAERETALGR